MKKKSKLSLNKEVITELNGEQLKAVNGGYSHPTTCGEYNTCDHNCGISDAQGNCNTVEDCFDTVDITCEAGCMPTGGEHTCACPPPTMENCESQFQGC